MEPVIQKLVDISESSAAMQARANTTLERARWAAQVFQRYDREHTTKIVDATAHVAHAKAGDYADWAVRETGFGVAAHKKLKNELSSVPLVDYYRNHDFINPQLDETGRIIEVPKPAGVIFALVPSTNPISTIYFKILSALMTRNAIVISPHPAARETSVDAVKALAHAAEGAGAPEGIIQVIEQPSIPLIDAFMKSDKTDVILATGGTPMVRAAYSSSNPAIGVGPGNAPVLVDDTTDLKSAAHHIVESKSFDNSVLCTNESVLIALDAIAKPLLSALTKAGCYVCTDDDVALLRRYLFHNRGFNVEALGRDASWIAKQAGLKNVGRAKVLITPISQIGVGEDLSREKLCPVLAFYAARNITQAITQARAVLRYTGAGHSAAIHSNDNQTILNYAAAVESYRVVVNAPCSQGAAGFASDLPPTFTIGTGYFGRSSVGENIGPKHLVNWTRIAWHQDAELDLKSLDLNNLHHPGPLQQAPADGVPGQSGRRHTPRTDGMHTQTANADELRDHIRQIIAEELKSVLKD